MVEADWSTQLVRMVFDASDEESKLEVEELFQMVDEDGSGKVQICMVSWMLGSVAFLCLSDGCGSIQSTRLPPAASPQTIYSTCTA